MKQSQNQLSVRSLLHAPVILLTRPELQADRFASQLAARFGNDIQLVISPLQSLTFLRPKIDIETDAHFIFTSENGVKSYVQSGNPITGTAWCVGPQTTKTAREFGFHAHDGGGTGPTLISRIKAEIEPCEMHYIQGKTRRVDIASALNKIGFRVKNHVTYVQTPTALTPEARRIILGDQTLIVPLFSPQSAALFVQEIENMAIKPIYVAISEPTAHEIGPDQPHIFISQKPTADAVCDTIKTLIDGKLPLAGYE